MNYDRFINPIIKSVPPSGIRKFFDIAAEMDDVISLSIGEPDFVTPWGIRQAAIRSLEEGDTHYTSNSGTIQLRRMCARYIEERFGPRYNPDNEILITVGLSEAIDLALRVLLNPGDEVLLPDPSYVAYAPGVLFAGGKPVSVPTYEKDDFKLMPENVRACVTERTKVIILPYPCNPTGAIMGKEDLEAIAQIVRETGIFVLSDEIYGELTYGGRKHVAFATLGGMWERTLTLNGFSKAFAMTGWRIGYACGPEPIIKMMCKIHQYTIMCAPTAGQVAAYEGLKQGFETDFEDVRRMRQEYDRRRRILVDGFRGMGLSCFEPLGAFYVFPSIRSTGLSSDEFCKRLLNEKAVATVPGTAFGEMGEGHIRCSYASSLENIFEAIKRFKEFLGSL